MIPQVAHLVNSTQIQKKDPPLLVVNYAVGGDTVEDVKVQTDWFMDQQPKGAQPIPWTEDNSLFGLCLYSCSFKPCSFVGLILIYCFIVFWVGINDCGRVAVSTVFRWP